LEEKKDQICKIKSAKEAIMKLQPSTAVSYNNDTWLWSHSCSNERGSAQRWQRQQSKVHQLQHLWPFSATISMLANRQR
jgi:hypothetical protein